ncbi:histidine phosphatase family protein [Chlorobium sp. N1]|uniref:SixA phosphatase family protein n=1 Tax=Chlorobium sp. N1 TaxID=2491138 RepID=UPI00103AB298|nr:histidine phosphatase family protein [Chlorobium sp. N1]TCD48128.1 histidine phosphatase family protein [Chlorobium sp. N1]
MKTLYLVRHAKAGWGAEASSDFERTLTDRGMKDAPAMARLVLERDGRPDLIVSSPAVRALTTAEAFAGVLQIPAFSIVRRMEIYERGAQELLGILRELPDEAESVMLFGHNPVISELAGLLGGRGAESMETCSVVRLDLPIAAWRDAAPGSGTRAWHEHPEKKHGH